MDQVNYNNKSLYLSIYSLSRQIITKYCSKSNILKKTFEFFDKDGSGDLDVNELQKALIYTFKEISAPCPP